MYGLEHKTSLLRIFLLLAGIGIAVAVLYGPVVLYDPALWQLNFFKRGFENDTRHIDLSYPLKFYFYSIPFAAVTLYNIWQRAPKERLKELIYLCACIALLMLFMRSYYLPYLFHFVAWRLSLKKASTLPRWFGLLYAGSFFAGLILCFGIPIYQLYDNKAYRDTFMDVLSYTKTVAMRYPDKKYGSRRLFP